MPGACLPVATAGKALRPQSQAGDVIGRTLVELDELKQHGIQALQAAQSAQMALRQQASSRSSHLNRCMCSELCGTPEVAHEHCRLCALGFAGPLDALPGDALTPFHGPCSKRNIGIARVGLQWDEGARDRRRYTGVSCLLGTLLPDTGSVWALR